MLMNLSDVLTWLWQIFKVEYVNIFSMLLTILFASRAKGAAAAAKKTRDDIAKHITHSELSNLNGLLGAAIHVMDKYGSGSTAVSRQSHSPENDATTVRAFVTEMTRLSGVLGKTFERDKIKSTINEINKILDAFGKASDETEKAEQGKNIFLEISGFSGHLKKELDKNFFR